MDVRKHTGVRQVAVFYLCLFAVRVIDNDILGSWESRHISEGLVGAWVWVLIKFAYWCLPILVYLALRKQLGRYLKDKANSRIGKPWLLLLIPLWGLAVVLNPANGAPDYSYFYIVSYVVATPVIEELAFRGFILDGLSQRFSFWQANLIQSILFALVHLPYLYELGKLSHPLAVVEQLASLVVFALLSGYLAKHTRSLVPSMLLHGVNNLLA